MNTQEAIAVITANMNSPTRLSPKALYLSGDISLDSMTAWDALEIGLIGGGLDDSQAIELANAIIGATIKCAFCGYAFPAQCGKYGCPNCNGDGLK
jgi:hypothetical protein